MFVIFDMIGVTVIICFLTTVLGYIYWKQTFSNYAKLINEYPGSSIIPIIGNIYILWGQPEKVFRTFREQAKKYASTWTLWSAHYGMVNIVTAEDTEIILSSNTHIEKHFVYDFISEWLGRGLLTSTGQKWQHRRKLLTPSFHFNILQKFVETFGEHSQNLVAVLKEECAKSKTDIIPIISNSTLQIICETAMGTTIDLNNKTHTKYFESVYKITDLLVKRSQSPWLYPSFIFYALPIGWGQSKILNILHSFTRSVIKERESNFKENDLKLNNNKDDTGIKSKKLVMLDLLISAKKNNGSVDDEGIREEVDTFMFEGHDTTSVALTYALLLLANHKEYQDKAAEELKDIFGDSTRLASYDDLQQMQYLELCLKESLRLFPSVPLIGRVINEELKLSKSIIPAGCVVNVHIYDLHRDERYFPDPEKFDPSRFLPENVKGRHPFAYVPFSAGPRNCIGQKFAMLEMKSIISSVLRNFILEPITTPDTCEIRADLVLRSSKEICVKFKPRE